MWEITHRLFFYVPQVSNSITIIPEYIKSYQFKCRNNCYFVWLVYMWVCFCVSLAQQHLCDSKWLSCKWVSHWSGKTILTVTNHSPRTPSTSILFVLSVEGHGRMFYEHAWCVVQIYLIKGLISNAFKCHLLSIYNIKWCIYCLCASKWMKWKWTETNIMWLPL